MHELAVAESVLASVLERTGDRHVSVVRLRIGRLAGVVPDALLFCFELAAAGTPLDQDRFRGQVGGTWREASGRATAHHSFQVFEVYPWAGLLRQGRPPGPAVSVLDRCRVRVGDVLAVDGEQVTVRATLLAWDGTALRRTEPVAEQARWSVDGHCLIDAPQVGDTVTVHWDWVCDVVDGDAARRVADLEADALAGSGLADQPPAGDLGEVRGAVR